MVVEHFELTVPGEPRGQGRPRFARAGAGVRTYTDEATAGAAARIQAEWIAAGRPVLAPGPYRMVVRAYLARPKDHYTTTSLSAKGLRSHYPARRPDISNVAKLAEDALVAVGAIPDDPTASICWGSSSGAASSTGRAWSWRSRA